MSVSRRNRPADSSGARCADRTVSPSNGPGLDRGLAGRGEAGRGKWVGAADRHASTESRKQGRRHLPLSAVSQGRSEPIVGIVRTRRRLAQAPPQAAHRRPDERVVTCRRCSGRGVFRRGQVRSGACQPRPLALRRQCRVARGAIPVAHERAACSPAGRRGGRSPAAQPAAVELRDNAAPPGGIADGPCPASNQAARAAPSGRFKRCGEPHSDCLNPPRRPWPPGSNWPRRCGYVRRC